MTNNGKPRYSLEDWWGRQTLEEAALAPYPSPMYTAEYWAQQQCSTEELNEWIKKQKEKKDES